MAPLSFPPKASHYAGLTVDPQQRTLGHVLSIFSKEGVKLWGTESLTTLSH